ncbi:WecB/TagA/CpsF family glycosyltransferase [Luteimonas kalidii]|uniref:WecB/TagA/CpsF family glycosyltransferase n=1 Tax=Luteimonas kalidii TaxID=3042025 RepID=A0ABT6JZ56_9GAMM|nr:WecB/TagA/CpsF family glycosyltransferase [Luteimonas kalidii]MDH5835576.1 WecB/TagA/CpsF family glycosyltransferase [Luteimonas kalidii]
MGDGGAGDGGARRFAIGDLVAIGGFRVLSTTLDAFAGELADVLGAGRPRRVLFANTNFVVQCQHLRGQLHDPSIRIVNDGIGMDLAALWLHGRRFAGNPNGTDLVPRLCERATTPLRFYLLGGRPGVAEAAADVLRREHGQVVVGVCDGYQGRARAGAALPARIEAAAPDILLVAFGNPLQEQWIVEHAGTLRVPLVLGVGALLDFLSGQAQRAPGWVRRWRLEWLYRLVHEPRRLLRRYSWDLLVFFRLCWQRRNG